MRKLFLTVVCLLMFSCAPKEDTRRELLKGAMDTGKELYLNTLINEIRSKRYYNKHTLDSIYQFRRDTILNNVLK